MPSNLQCACRLEGLTLGADQCSFQTCLLFDVVDCDVRNGCLLWRKPSRTTDTRTCTTTWLLGRFLRSQRATLLRLRLWSIPCDPSQVVFLESKRSQNNLSTRVNNAPFEKKWLEPKWLRQLPMPRNRPVPVSAHGSSAFFSKKLSVGCTLVPSKVRFCTNKPPPLCGVASAISPTPMPEKLRLKLKLGSCGTSEHSNAGTWSVAHDVAKITVSRKRCSEAEGVILPTNNWWTSCPELQLSPRGSINETMPVQRVRRTTTASRILKV